MSAIQSFPPIESEHAKVLILGSIPGVLSLQQAQYYAHPRNAFWPIMARLFNFDPALPYQHRTQQLQAQGVCVWDVLQSCYRKGSLDADIQQASETANDFSRFFARHSGIERVFFNGSKAQQSFQRYVLADLPETCARLQYDRLPSTSPAMAMLTVDQKFAQWRLVKEPFA